jgi:urease gamma subunit
VKGVDKFLFLGRIVPLRHRPSQAVSIVDFDLLQGSADDGQQGPLAGLATVKDEVVTRLQEITGGSVGKLIAELAVEATIFAAENLVNVHDEGGLEIGIASDCTLVDESKSEKEFE